MAKLVLVVASLLLFTHPCLAQEMSGSVAGTVRFTGTVPPDTRIMTTDGGVIMHNDLVVDAKTKGLRHVVVHLEKAPEHKTVAKKGRVVMDQRDMLFLPRVIAVQDTQTVRFDNSDLCNHCVKATSLVPANNFNIVTLPGQPYDTELKAHKHPVIVDCPIHTWMKGYVFVFDHPFFAVTDASGAFRIGDLPPGKYSVVFRHIDTGTQETRSVTVTSGAKANVNIEWNKTGKK